MADYRDYPAEVSCRSKLLLVRHIKKLIRNTPREQLFRQTCFGWLLDIQKMQESGVLVHYFLCHQVPCDEGETNIVPLRYRVRDLSRVNEVEIKFGREEFCLVTSLRFGTDFRHLYKDGPMLFRRRVFPSTLDSRSIRVGTLFNIIKGKQFFDLSDEDAVRVCLISVLMLVLQGTEIKKVVDDWLFRLVEDINAWNMYPWGSYVLPKLYKNIKDAALVRRAQHFAEGRDPNKHPNYSLNGFIWAFNIPFDLQVDIMKKLPVKSLLQFRTVSKRWKSSIDLPNFIRSYGFCERDMCCFNLTYMQGNIGFMFSVNENLAFTNLETTLNLPTLKPIATSEGVWCFSYGSNMMVVLWNPSIKRSVGIFVPTFSNQPDSPKMVIGFGVRPDNLDPTLLKINYPYYGQGPWYVSVYTLSSRHWNNLENDRLPRESIRIKRCGQEVVGGKNFWIGSEKFVHNDGVSYKHYMIVSFDLVTHQFTVQNIPDLIRFTVQPPYYISQLRNSLVVSGSYLAEECKVLCAWELEFVGGVVSSCPLLFTVPFPIDNEVKLLGFTKAAEPIVQS